MARKRRLPYKCEYCPKHYATLQAKWGHFPQCEARKESLQLASKPKAEALPSTLENSESRRPGPDSQEMKLYAYYFDSGDSNSVREMGLFYAEIPRKA